MTVTRQLTSIQESKEVFVELVPSNSTSEFIEISRDVWYLMTFPFVTDDLLTTLKQLGLEKDLIIWGYDPSYGGSSVATINDGKSGWAVYYANNTSIFEEGGIAENVRELTTVSAEKGYWVMNISSSSIVLNYTSPALAMYASKDVYGNLRAPKAGVEAIQSIYRDVEFIKQYDVLASNTPSVSLGDVVLLNNADYAAGNTYEANGEYGVSYKYLQSGPYTITSNENFLDGYYWERLPDPYPVEYLWRIWASFNNVFYFATNSKKILAAYTAAGYEALELLPKYSAAWVFSVEEEE